MNWSRSLSPSPRYWWPRGRSEGLRHTGRARRAVRRVLAGRRRLGAVAQQHWPTSGAGVRGGLSSAGIRPEVSGPSAGPRPVPRVRGGEWDGCPRNQGAGAPTTAPMCSSTSSTAPAPRNGGCLPCDPLCSCLAGAGPVPGRLARRIAAPAVGTPAPKAAAGHVCLPQTARPHEPTTPGGCRLDGDRPLLTVFATVSGWGQVRASSAAPKDTSKRSHQMVTLRYRFRSTSAGSV